MKLIRKIYARLFLAGRDEISLHFLAFAVSTLSCGVVILWLWVVHTPVSLTASDTAHLTCLNRCEQACGATAG